MSFKGNKVWVETDLKGDIIVDNEKVLIKYNLKQNYEYRVRLESLKPEEKAIPSKKKTKTSPPEQKGESNNENTIKIEKEKQLPDNCIKIYTDGASSGNPGPAGIGALLIYGDRQKRISEYIGHSTNNIAELTAIKIALTNLKRHDLPVRIFSDSSYAIGLLSKDWKSQKNQKLVSDIKSLLNNFSDLAFIKVKGHAGIKENEVADYLATSAIKKGLE